jgi:hypothetical protein
MNKEELKSKNMNKFCPDETKDFIDKLSLLIKHIKENYDRTEFDLWEEPSESYSIDSVKHDFAIVCSNFFISDNTMIEYFDEYLSIFKENQIKEYENDLEQFIIKKQREKALQECIDNENYEMCVKLRDTR